MAKNIVNYVEQVLDMTANVVKGKLQLIAKCLCKGDKIENRLYTFTPSDVAEMKKASERKNFTRIANKSLAYEVGLSLDSFSRNKAMATRNTYFDKMHTVVALALGKNTFVAKNVFARYNDVKQAVKKTAQHKKLNVETKKKTAKKVTAKKS